METFKLEKEPFLFLPTQEVHLHCVLEEIGQALKDVSYLHESDKERSREALSILVDTSPDWRRNGVACFHRRVKNLEQNLAVLVRLENPVPSPQGGHIRFVWLLLSGAATHPRLDVAVEFARLAKNPDFTSALLRAEKADDLFDAYAEEPHSSECGFGPCARCVVDEFATALDPSASTVSEGGSDV